MLPLAVLAASHLPSALAAQSIGDWKPVIQGGVSVSYVDIEDPHRAIGGAFRIGARMRPMTISGIFLHWGEVRGAPMTSALVEFTYPGASTGRVTGALLATLGHTWWQIPRASDWVGGKRAGGVGVSLLARAAARVDLRLDALMRSDGEGFSTEFRVMGGWAPALPEADSPGPGRFAIASHWMFAASGPWRFVEPAYMVRFSRPEVGRWGGTFELGVLHWQVPGATSLRDYIWDTRAFIAQPGVEWRTRWGLAGLRFAGGPALVVMGEGPDDGPNLGAHIDTAVSLGAKASIAGTLGWFWMRSSNGGDARVPDGDVHGLTLGLVIEF